MMMAAHGCCRLLICRVREKIQPPIKWRGVMRRGDHIREMAEGAWLGPEDLEAASKCEENKRMTAVHPHHAMCDVADNPRGADVHASLRAHHTNHRRCLRRRRSIINRRCPKPRRTPNCPSCEYNACLTCQPHGTDAARRR